MPQRKRDLETGAGGVPRGAAGFPREDRAGWLSKLLFAWFLPIVRYGHKHTIEDADLNPVAATDDPERLYATFTEHWDKEQAAAKAENRKPGMVKVMLRTVGVFEVSLACVLSIVQAASMATVPFVSKWLLESLSEDDSARNKQIGLAVGMVLLPLVGSYSQAQVMYISRRGSMHLFTAFTQAIFNKSLRLNSASRNLSSSGQLVNLIATDAGTALERSILLIYPLFLAPILLVILLYLVYQEIGISMLTGFVVIFLAMPVNLKIFVGLTKVYGKTIAMADDRIKLVNEALQAVRVLKMYAWEIPFVKKIRAMREKELVYLRQHSFLFSVGLNAVFLQLPYLIQFGCFTTYYLLGETFYPWTIFTAIQLFQQLQQQLTQLPNAVSQLSQSKVAAQRITKFLLLEELDAANTGLTRNSTSRGTIDLREASFTWDVDPATLEKNAAIKAEADKNSKKPSMLDLDAMAPAADVPDALKDISLSVQPGEKVAILGKVASGKSSLLLSVTGELRRTKGDAFGYGKISYSSQTPFVLSMSLRENILFGKAFDEDRYAKVIDACSLTTDLEIMSAGDKTYIGERGINLSGGQKARVSLARAVYADADIVLLDDPLCAVDSHVGADIMDNCIFGPLMEGKTLLLTTNKLDRLDEFDRVVLLEDGRIAQQGKWGVDVTVDAAAIAAAEAAADDKDGADGTTTNEEISAETAALEELGDTVSPAIAATAGGAAEDVPQRAAESTLSTSSRGGRVASARPESRMQSSAVSGDGKEQKKGEELYSEEEEAIGTLKFSVLVFFVKMIGAKIFYPGYLLYVVYLFTPLFAQLILTHWTDEVLCQSPFGVGQVCDAPVRGESWWFMMYGIILGSGLLMCVIAGVFIALARVSGSRNLHDSLLTSTFSASITNFFDVRPLGRILNRFAKDISIVDFPLSQMFMFGVVTVSYAASGFVGIIIGTTGYFVLFFVPIIILYVMLYRSIRKTAIQLQRLESKSRSPIYSNFSEVLNGLKTIRAFRSGQRFVDKNQNILTNNIEAYFIARVVLPASLMVIVNFLGALIMAAVCIYVLLAKDVAPGRAGLALTFSLQLSGILNGVVMILTEIEISMNSVERIKSFADDIEPEDPLDRLPAVTDGAAGKKQLTQVVVEATHAYENWPDKGVVEIKDLVMGYRDGPDVIHGITLTIRTAEKIGIVGRTGSGKSSLLLALLRIVEPRSGSIIIDGVDICKMPLVELRSRLAIIPQSPVVFQDTLRFNLDPFNQCSDDELNEALEAVQLGQFVGQLDMELVEGGDNVSEGQRQLICFVRAILRKSRLLMLDEASAMLDKETDRLLQQLVRRTFKDRTVLTIAHRLDTVIDSTRVLVLDQGHIAEFAAPEELLARPDSVFASMVAAERGEEEAPTTATEAGGSAAAAQAADNKGGDEPPQA